MTQKFSFLIVLVAILVTSCSKKEEKLTTVDDTILYSNSFENTLDLEDFEGFEFALSDDTPTGGGDSSLVVSGGCVVPHLTFESGPFDEVKNLTFRIYGKAQDMTGGAVILSLESDPETNIFIVVDSNDWAVYESASALEVPVGEKVNIEFRSGGIVPVTTLFDLLEIED